MLKIAENEHIQRNFLYNEFMCHCGCGEVKVNYKLAKLLQNIRNCFKKIYGFARVDVECGYRCKTHNNELIRLYNEGKFPNKPAENSRHLYGEAADIHVYYKTEENSEWLKADPATVANIAKAYDATGIGIYNTFTHVDVRNSEFSTWDNRG